MAAQIEGRDPNRVASEAIPVKSPTPLDVASGVTIYGGSLVFVNSSGRAVALSPDQTMTCAGYAESDVDNSTGGNGDETITPRIGCISLVNGGDIAADDVHKMAYASDNQTAYLSSSGGTRCAIGPILGLDGSRVFVMAGLPYNRAIADLGSLNASDYTTVANLVSTANAKGASLVGIEDASAFYPGTNLETVFDNIESALGGTNTSTRTYASTNVVANNDSFFTAVGKLDGKFGDIASTANAKGASLVGVEDASGFLAAANVEAALLEIVKFNPALLADPGTAQAIPVTRSATIEFTVGAGAETNTLAIPAFVGQTMRLYCGTVGGGTRAVTAASAINVAGNTVMTFNAARDYIVLNGVSIGGTRAWEVAFNANVALS